MIFMLVIAVLMSAVGIYYYFRAIIASYFREGNGEAIEVRPFYKLILLLTTTLTILLGVAPDLVRSLF